nr:N-acetylneuraminate synthase family protein [uncultured Deefgea sp.]
MIIVMQLNAQEQQIVAVIERIREAGLKEHVSRGAELVIIGAIGDEDRINQAAFEVLPGVERVSRVTKQYKMVSRATHPSGIQFKVRGVVIGGEQVQVFAGVHSLASSQNLQALASATQAAGSRVLWSRIEQAGYSPYEFHAPEFGGLASLRDVARRNGVPFAVEVNDVQTLDFLLAHDVDVIQLGAQSMQNRALLRELGRLNKPVILRRGLAATVTDWLLAAEAIAAGGNHHIVLCEQGARGSLDVATISMLKRETYLPVFVDVSHASAKSWMVSHLALAAVASGADGLMVDVHSSSSSVADYGDQSLALPQFERVMASLRAALPALGRAI